MVRRAAAGVYQRLATDGAPLLHQKYRDPARFGEVRLGLLRDAIALDPENPDLMADAARLHGAEGRLEDAVRAFEEAIERDGSRGVYHRELAAVRERAGRPDLAIAHYQAALRIDPSDFAAHLALARLYVAAERLSEAASHVEWAISIDPSSEESHLLQAQILDRTHGAQRASGYLHLALSCYDASGALQFETARQVARLGEGSHHVLEHLQKAKNARYDTTRGKDLPDFERYRAEEPIRKLLEEP